MILFEANAVAPLVKLPDAAKEERVQLEMVGLVATTGRRKSPKAPPLQKTQGWTTRLQRRKDKGVNTKAREGGGAEGESGIQCGQSLSRSPITTKRERSLETRWRQL